MTKIVISCILIINGKKKVQLGAGKMDHTLFSCRIGGSNSSSSISFYVPSLIAA